ncbi:hypothetical protein [Methylobacterium frigidaeris]|nr:hypothetical protein [Methylobacterium frigidaeris]
MNFFQELNLECALPEKSRVGRQLHNCWTQRHGRRTDPAVLQEKFDISAAYEQRAHAIKLGESPFGLLIGGLILDNIIKLWYNIFIKIKLLMKN